MTPQAGADWIRRDGAAVAAHGGRILRWDYWRQHPSFKPVHSALVDLYRRWGVFAEGVDQDAPMFLG